MKPTASISKIKLFIFFSISFALTAGARDISLMKTQRDDINQLRRLLRDDSMKLTGNCFADEKPESTFGNYDNSTDDQHYGELGNLRDEDASAFPEI